MILGFGCVLLLIRHSVAGRIRAMIRIALILLTAYWASDVTWAAGWQQRVLGWPERSGGIAPFAGPVAIWLIVFIVLTAVSLLLSAKAIRKLQTDPIEMAGLFTLSAANAVTCWYLYDRIGGV